MAKLHIFDVMALAEHIDDHLLGYPPRSKEAMERKISHFASLTGGKGFRTPKKEPRVYANGKTRGEMKREARFETNQRIIDQRGAVFSL